MAADSDLVVSAQERDAQTVVLTVKGEVDAASNATLRGGIEDALTAGHKKVLLDMTGVSFIDSAGLRVLIDSQKLGDSTGASVMIESASDVVTRLLEMTALTERFMS
jgi:anti-anti-sigma factor